MALTNSVKGDEIEKQNNEISTEKPVEAVEGPIRSRTSQRKAATAAVNAMKEQALGARKAENEDDEGKPKRGGRGRPKAAPVEKVEKSRSKSSRKRASSTDEEEEDEKPPKSKRGKPKAASKPAPKKKEVERSSGRRPGRPSKAAKEDALKESEEDENKEDDKADDKADESNSGEENASKTE